MDEQNLDNVLDSSQVKHSYIQREKDETEWHRYSDKLLESMQSAAERAEERKKTAYGKMTVYSLIIHGTINSAGLITCDHFGIGNSYYPISAPSSLIQQGLTLEKNPKLDHYKINAYLVERRYEKTGLFRKKDVSACIGRMCIYFDLDGNPLNNSKKKMVIYGERNVDRFLALEKTLCKTLGYVDGFDKDVYYRDEKPAKLL